MNVLFMNRDSGCGVEFEGNLFIDILRRTTGIENIDIYKSQCRRAYKEFDFSPYDLIILNDFSVNEYDQSKLNVGVPVININFGGTGNRSEVIDIVLDINMLYTSLQEIDMWNYYSLNFISGNIWKPTTKWEERSDEVLYVSRLAKEKIQQGFIDTMRNKGKRIVFYGPIIDREIYEQNKDVIDYKGYVNHKELLDVYNQYKSVYLFSNTECLSMTLREALLCGCVPIIDDRNGYTKPIEKYCIICNDYDVLDIVNELIIYKHNIIENERQYLKNYFSFDKMILDFIFCLRGLTLRPLGFDRNYRANTRVLDQPINDNSEPYANDSVNWDDVKI